MDRDEGRLRIPVFDLRSLSPPSGKGALQPLLSVSPQKPSLSLSVSHTTSLETVACICPHIVVKIYIQPPSA